MLLLAVVMATPVKLCQPVNGTVVCHSIPDSAPSMSCKPDAYCDCVRDINIRCANGLICGYTRAQYYDANGLLRGPECTLV
ncbi:hypothetical protein EDD86DRAFT_133851 [Gorgonomyces haynaldii]|nr:hypothetical protein EDD86DRAFT_133851 [Gorgonomyces haynaldii]